MIYLIFLHVQDKGILPLAGGLFPICISSRLY